MEVSATSTIVEVSKTWDYGRQEEEEKNEEDEDEEEEDDSWLCIPDVVNSNSGPHSYYPLSLFNLVRDNINALSKHHHITTFLTTA
ncbi:hypothetical protein E2C01_102342 [Portunus trituberculatus]|uniref:Uncharacterized protein n=1 Tax=Portunus trituberculatus TaxID=210409 RepID=A0A5B7KIA8_PORTR|nr:hypothetical protein [Portunus trituberculatus]